MADHFGLEYEPKPHWTECVRCGARRPPSSLKDGKCALWEFASFAEVYGEVSTLRIDRCEELALSKEKT